MAEVTGSEILAKALKKEGTKDLFFIMGGPMQLAQTHVRQRRNTHDRRAPRAGGRAVGAGL